MTDDDPTAGDLGDEHGEDVVVLRANAMKWAWVIIGSLAFAAFGAAMAFSTHTGIIAKGIGWVLVAGFGLCVWVSIREFRAPGALSITRDQIEVISRGRRTTFAMADCGRFVAWRNPSRGNTMVVFDYRRDGDTELARANRHLMGGSRCLADGYGLPTDTLVELLNQARVAGLHDRNRDN